MIRLEIPWNTLHVLLPQIEDAGVGVNTLLQQLLRGGVAVPAVPVERMILREDRELIEIHRILSPRVSGHMENQAIRISAAQFNVGAVMILQEVPEMCHQEFADVIHGNPQHDGFVELGFFLLDLRQDHVVVENVPIGFEAAFPLVHLKLLIALPDTKVTVFHHVLNELTNERIHIGLLESLLNWIFGLGSELDTFVQEVFYAILLTELQSLVHLGDDPTCLQC